MIRSPRTFTKHAWFPLRRNKLSLRPPTFISITDTLTLTQTIVNGSILVRSITDTLTSILTQTISFTHNDYIQLDQSLSLTQTISPLFVFNRTITQPLTLTDSLGIVRSISATDTLFIRQSIDYDLISGTVDTIDLSCNIYSIDISLTDHLILKQCVTYDHVHPVHHINRNIYQTLSLFDGANYTIPKVINQSITDTLPLTQNIYIFTGNLITITVPQTLTITQSNIASIGPLINESINQSLTLTQTIIPSRVLHQAIVQSLTLTQSFSKFKIITKRIKDHLLFTPTITISRLITQHISHLLQFKDNYYQRLLNYDQPIDIPIIIPIIVDNRLKSRQYMTLKSAKSTPLLLPAPEFSNSERFNGQINIKRTITGDLFTYVKTSPDEANKYSFLLTTNKRRELFNFYRDNHSLPILIQNWRNELWIGFLTNNPIVTNNSHNDLSEVELEFDGLKILG